MSEKRELIAMYEARLADQSEQLERVKDGIEVRQRIALRLKRDINRTKRKLSSLTSPAEM